MLEFVRNVFRGFFNVVLWVCLIACAIGGAVVGASINGGGGAFIGIIIGILAGIVIDVVGGGIVATLLNIDDNLEQLRIKMSNSSFAGGIREEINLSNVPPIAPINRNYGDTWTCKKCNEINPNTAPTCKGCGGYK